MSEHTPEPWMTPEALHSSSVYQRDEIGPGYARGIKIADTSAKGFGLTPQERKANARRIVACVNACAGIPTEALKDGSVKALVDAAEAVRECLQDGDDVDAFLISANGLSTALAPFLKGDTDDR